MNACHIRSVRPRGLARPPRGRPEFGGRVCCGDQFGSLNRSGLTLLEVLMVIIISAAAVGVAGVGGLFHQGSVVRQETAEVTQLLRTARETALLTKCEVKARLIYQTHKPSGIRCFAVELQSEPSPFSPAINRFGEPATDGGQWMVDPIWLDPKLSVKAEPREIVFNPDGTAQKDAQWVLYFDDTKSEIRVLQVNGNITTQTP